MLNLTQAQSKFVLAVLTGVLAVLLPKALAATWALKVDRSDFERQEARLEAYFRQDSIWKVEQRDLVIRLYCQRNPDDSQCPGRPVARGRPTP